MKKRINKLTRALLILTSLALMATTSISIGATPNVGSDFVRKPPPQAMEGKKRSYIVLMEGLPLVAYEGDIKGMPVTKPAKGKKVNANSAAAKKYKAHLKANQNKAMRGAGVSKKAQTNSSATRMKRKTIPQERKPFSSLTSFQ